MKSPSVQEKIIDTLYVAKALDFSHGGTGGAYLEGYPFYVVGAVHVKNSWGMDICKARDYDSAEMIVDALNRPLPKKKAEDDGQ